MTKKQVSSTVKIRVRSKTQAAYYSTIKVASKVLAKEALKRVEGNKGSAKMALMGAVALIEEKVKKEREEPEGANKRLHN